MLIQSGRKVFEEAERADSGCRQGYGEIKKPRLGTGLSLQYYTVALVTQRVPIVQFARDFVAGTPTYNVGAGPERRVRGKQDAP